MRVVVNELATLGRRTGVGHYTAELVRAPAPADTVRGPSPVSPIPVPCRVRQAWAWLRRVRAAQGGAPGGGALHNHGRSALAALLPRSSAACRGFDLYHEPNFLPLPVRPADGRDAARPVGAAAPRVAPCRPRRRLRARLPRRAGPNHPRHHRLRICASGDHSRPGRSARAGDARLQRRAPGPASAAARSRWRRACAASACRPEYLLYVGTLEPRKNLLTLLRAYCRLPDAGAAALSAAAGRRLGLASRAPWPTILTRAGEPHGRAPPRLRRRRGTCRLLYNGARALAFPSLYEGFGLPPVEMLACGGAVLASTAGAVAETVGGRRPPDRRRTTRTAGARRCCACCDR